MLEPYVDFVLFKTDVLFNDKVKFKGVNGQELVIETSFDPQRHVRIYGEVVAVPERLRHIPIEQEHKGLPSPVDQVRFNYKFLDDIEMEVQVGDRIYFHFNTIRQENFVNIEGTHPNRTWTIKVRYDMILCVVRKGEIIPIGGYALIRPDWETWEDISIPTPSEIKGVDGKPLMKPKDQWLVTKSAPGYKFLQGYVEHIGKPLKGNKCEVRVGQKIWYHRNADWMVNIEGKDYFVIKQKYIIGREE